MEKTPATEIKKALYKQKPIAKRILIQRDKMNIEVHTYRTAVSIGGIMVAITFKIPENEAKEFETEMEAQLLIRWLA